MVALILADGDAPSRAVLDAAWPGWVDDVGLVVAADGGARHAAALGLRRRPVGRRRRLGRSGHARRPSRRAGVEVRRRPTDKDESDTELARPCGPRARTPTAIVVLGALGGPRLDHALANIGAAGHARAGRPRRPARHGATLAHPARLRRRRAARAPSELGRPDRGPRLAAAGRRRRATASRRPGLRYPLRDEALRLGPPRGLSNVVDAADAGVSVRDGLLLVVETPATLRRMSMPTVGDPAPEVALPDETGTVHAWPTSAAAGPSCTSTPRTTRPAAPSRRASSATPTRPSPSAARTSGASARRAPRASGRSARSSACRSRSSPTRTTRSPRPTARGSRSRTTARRTWAPRGRRSWSIPTGRIAQVWPKVKPEGHAADVLAALDEAQAGGRLTDGGPDDGQQEASLVGGDERSLGRKRTPAP